MPLTPISRFWSMLRMYKFQLRQIYAYAVFIGIVNLTLPLGIQAIINYIQTGQISSAWIVLVGFVLVGIAITGILQVLQLRVVENIQQDIFARSTFEFAYRIPRINYIELDKIHAPELVNRIFDTLTIQKGLPKILIDFSLAVFQITFGLLLLTIYSPFFIILAVSLVFILWLIFRFTGPRGLETSLKESKYKYQIAHWLEEVARVNRSFKLYADHKLHLNRTDEITYNYLCARENHFQILLSQFRFFVGFKVFIAAGLLLLGGFLVFNEQMNIGQFVAAEIIIILIINSIEKVIRVIDSIYDVLTALEKIGYVTDLELDKKKGAAVIDEDQGMAITARDLEFTYPNAKKPTIEHLDFHIPAGGKVVIHGETGSGKSTLLQLLAGILEPTDGELDINNIPYANYNWQQVNEELGVAFPTNQLFDGSIRENITMGRTVSDKKLSQVIQLLNLTEFIAHQQDGINAHIDSGGRRLPRSVIQRLIIARILLDEPKLLLLEDPLQFVAEKEKKIIINELMREDRPWTVIVVEDNPYWEEKCTQVIELKK